MQGNKIVQARLAALAMLDHLGPLDRFNVIAFDDAVVPFRSGPILAGGAELAEARAFVEGIFADGSTNLDGAITTGLTGLGGEEVRFDGMILLSDGMATAGETNDVVIHQNAIRNNPDKARIFTFSVGRDADLALMEALARSNRGRHFQLNDAQADSELVDRVRELFEDIRMPTLTGLELDVAAVGAADVLPERMGDVFAGGQALLVGRYQNPGAASIVIEGYQNGQPWSRTIDVDAPALAEDNGFIKYVWATEKVGELLADMSRGGDRSALEAQIRELGLAYRIQTPYTSFSTRDPAVGGDPGGGGGGGSGGGGGGGGGWGAGAAGPIELLVALVLCAAGARRRRRR
jgi:Ca-activated chloride channel family protein